MFGVTAGWAELSARRTLCELHEQLGAAGLGTAAVLPGLAAAVDQHSAAVRDVLTLGVEGAATVAGVVLLAGYARGLLDQARELGWRLRVPAEIEGWQRLDWLTSRLLAVCDLAARVDEPQADLAF